MPQVINTNIASLNAQRNLNMSQDSLNVSLQRLSAFASTAPRTTPPVSRSRSA